MLSTILWQGQPCIVVNLFKVVNANVLKLNKHFFFTFSFIIIYLIMTCSGNFK